MKKTDVIIIGAGSAGLSALRQVQRRTDRYLIVDPGPLGTTCARIGCMPSKALIHVARQFHGARRRFADRGIRGADGLACDLPAVLRHVRGQRDRFTRSMVELTRQLAGDHLVEAPAEFEAPNRVRIGEEGVETGCTIIATGSRPIVPAAWRAFGDRVLTSETLFEQEDLPRRLAVIGLGPIGLELGQALGRLGREVVGFDKLPTVGGLTDPRINTAALDAIGGELPLHLGAPAQVEASPGGLRVRTDDEREEIEVDAVIAAMGVRPNLQPLRLERLGIALDANGLPPFDCRSLRIGDLPVFVAGDASRCRPILHEALDEGFIAGRNLGDDDAYCRRVPLRIVFSDPQIAGVGPGWDDLQNELPELVVGEVDFADQSRALVEDQAAGLLRVYVHPESARILGAEMASPGAEHLSHQLALMVQNKMTLDRALQSPFYHPTLEEALRSAFRDARGKMKPGRRAHPDELLLCESAPEAPLR